MIRRALPVVARIRGRLFGQVAIATRAAEIIELSPEIERSQPAAISLPDEIDRVAALQEETTPALEASRLNPGRRKHAATVAYRIDNAILAEGTLYFDGGYDVFRPKSASPLLPKYHDHIAEAQLCTNSVIERYFGHWVRDGMSLELLASERSSPAVTFAGTPWLHEAGYRELLGLHSMATNHARVDRLWVVDNRGLNDSWVAQFKELRRRVRAVAAPRGPKRIMLARGTLGVSRTLINLDEVQTALAKVGFEFVTPETETVVEIAKKLAHAEIAIMVEGSVQNHCLLAMTEGSTLMTIQPANRFTAHSKSYADAIGLNWAYVIADVAPGGFRVSVDRLLRTIDKALPALQPDCWRATAQL